MRKWLGKKQPSRTIDDVQLIANAKSFIAQDFWNDMLQKMHDMREGALGQLRQRCDTVEDDLRNLEHWRAVETITTQLENYPISVIEQEKSNG